VVGRQVGGHRLAREHRFEVEIGVVLRVFEHPEVEIAASERLHLFQRGKVRHLGGIVRLPLVQGGEKPEEAHDRQVRDAADAKDGSRPSGAAGLRDGPVEARQHLAGLFGEHAPRFGGRDDPARAVQELDSELVLELANRL
jgi:hypothetical protein